jgi:hypothetical protein
VAALRTASSHEGKISKGKLAERQALVTRHSDFEFLCFVVLVFVQVVSITHISYFFTGILITW